ncbi:MAG: hypothetical protein HGA65_02685, partial [Oscillochloris sp.]|nr:hypothetical protein [Oscillochloris sp.]
MMAIFELIDPVAGAPAPPGPWVSRPAAPVSFGVGTVPDAGAPIWRVNLPDDPQRARTALREAGQGLRAQQTALAAATDRIGRLAGGGASFAIGQQAAPELALLRLVGELRGEGEASFGLRETVSGGWNEAEQRFRAFAAQVH